MSQRDPVDGSEAAARLDPDRLAALRRSGLLDSPPEEAFDRATRLATRLLGTPVSLVSIVDRDRQFFKSQVGLPQPWASRRETPLSHSFCQYVVGSGRTLAIDDAREHPVLRDNLAIRDLDVVAYLGIPLADPEGHILGAFCVISSRPRVWDPEDRAVLSDLAAQVATELRLRASLAELADEVRWRRDLLAMLAHDVRSPASTILSGVETSRAHAQRPEVQAQFVDLVERQAERICRLADSLLTAEGGATTPALVDLRELVSGAVTGVGGPSAASRVRVQVPAATLTLDEAAVEQIVVNLTDNALKHTDGTVAVSADVDGETLALAVRDEGPGLDAQVLRELLAPGRRGATSAAGHGLGLHIVRVLVDRLGGQLDIDSSPGGGSTFTVTLPPAGD